jgi:hypothetical protein
MKRFFAVLSVMSLAVVMSVTAIAQSPSTKQSKPEQLSKKQFNALIASAKTPAEHERIAQYYAASAQSYRAEAKEHESMIAAYKANTSLSNEKNRASTIGHCEYFVKSLNDLSVKSDELAKLHQDMAKESSK